MMIKMRRSKGFTLVELLLVVAILAVLAFLAVPAIAETIKNSRMRTCGSNEHMIETNIWRWYADGVAAGLTIVLADGTYDDGNSILDFDEEFDHTDSAWPELAPYFTPGGPPKCPFTNNDVAYEIQFKVAQGGLADVFVICKDSVEYDGTGHDRASDRRTTGNGVGEFPGPAPVTP